MDLLKLIRLFEGSIITRPDGTIFWACKNRVLIPIKSCDSHWMNHVQLQWFLFKIIVYLKSSTVICCGNHLINWTALYRIYSYPSNPRPNINLVLFLIKAAQSVVKNLLISSSKYNVVMIPLQKICVKIISPFLYLCSFKRFIRNHSFL